jgi:hypothetical protein
VPGFSSLRRFRRTIQQSNLSFIVHQSLFERDSVADQIGRTIAVNLIVYVQLNSLWSRLSESLDDSQDKRKCKVHYMSHGAGRVHVRCRCVVDYSRSKTANTD